MSSPLLRVLVVAAVAASCSNAVTPAAEVSGGGGGGAAPAVSEAGMATSGSASVMPPIAGAGGAGAGGNVAAAGSSAANVGGAGGGGAGLSGNAGGGVGAADGCAGLFCEDFESGALAPATWTVQANQGQTVKVQSELAAHGKYAVQFHGAPNVVSYDFIIASHAPAALNGHHFGRAYFQVTPKPPEKHTELIFAGTSGFPKLKYLEVAESDLGWQLTYVQLVAPTGERYTPATGTVPLAKWACLEWEMNDAPDQIHLSVDGVSAVAFGDITFMSKSSGLVGGFTDFGFGYYIWHPATYAFDVYYDDIVLDTKPIGCLK